jgi:hypothetical protein
LNTARTNAEIEIAADSVFVESITGSLAAKLNESDNDSLDLAVWKTITTPIYRLFLTNSVQAGKIAVLIFGRDDLFIAER